MARNLKRGRIYTEEEKRTALEFAAVHGVNAAASQLDINRSSLRAWRQQMPEYWSSLRANDPEAQQKGFAQRLEDLAEGYVAAEEDALERAAKLIPVSDAKETAALIKAMGSARGLATVNARAARGQHDEVEININFPAIEQLMEQMLEAGSQPALPVPNEAETDETRND